MLRPALMMSSLAIELPSTIASYLGIGNPIPNTLKRCRCIECDCPQRLAQEAIHLIFMLFWVMRETIIADADGLIVAAVTIPPCTHHPGGLFE